MDASTQAITIASAALPQVRLHPLVLLHVYNHYVRRKDTASVTKVIGALLGYKTEQGIEISDCFSLPPPESLENRALERYCDDWYALHSKVYSREQIVGWYISCDDDEPILEWTSQLHEIFARRCERQGIQAVHLVVDTATAKSEMGAKAFVANRVRLGPGMDIATAYHQVQLTLVASDSEKICMQHLVEGVDDDAEAMLKATEPLSQGFQRPAMLQTQLPNTHDALAGAIQRLLTLVSGVHDYVNDVVEGRRQPDAEIGSALADVMAEITPLETQALESFFATKRQDLLMVEYLTSLTRTQVSIAEKLNAII